ncbi:MAG TPA: iron-containing alcohol dehydrogenase [Spirochaetia bacterium]|nr:iron-containing alcohol dehydrogenase [Spirochaetia bacterium]
MSTTYSQYMLRTAIHSGTGCRMMVPDLLRAMGARRTVLFTDQGLVNAGVMSRVAEIFDLTTRGSGPDLVGVFDGIQQDARNGIINQAARFSRDLGADSLVALGGGSVMDTVKGVKFMLHTGLTDILEAIPGNLALHAWPQAQYILIPHIAIPTTAGTGAEVSPIAVILNEVERVKASLIHPFINADMAVMDPELTVGLPPEITAFTGMDALTHALEALNSPTATALTDAYALHAIRLIDTLLPVACQDGTNLKARANLLMASTMAITAFSFALSAVPVHNFAHTFGARFGIPHGMANAIFLPEVMRYLPDLYLPRSADMAGAFSLPVAGLDAREILALVIDHIHQLRDKVGLPRTFGRYDISREKLTEVVPAVVRDPAGVFFRLPPEIVIAVSTAVCGLDH